MKHTLFVFNLLVFVIVNCKWVMASETAPDIRPDEAIHAVDAATRNAWELGQQPLINSEQALRNFSAQAELFLNEPSETNLTQLRLEWRNSHQQWQQHTLWLVVARDQEKEFTELKQRYFAIDARELQPGYLDAVQDYPFSGIVNDISIVLSGDNLRQQHGLTDNSEVSLGFHALELLLWGEQGLRQFTDFQAINSINSEQNAAGLTTSDLPNNRRRTLLRLISQLLTDDIQRLRQDWQNSQSMISQSYLNIAPQTRLALLRKASQQLLANELPLQLNQLSSSDKYTHHNQFAGDTYQSSLAVLTGLEQLLTSGPLPLLHWLDDQQQALDWQQQLRLQISILNELSGETGEAATGKIASVNIQLQQLASALVKSTGKIAGEDVASE